MQPSHTTTAPQVSQQNRYSFAGSECSDLVCTLHVDLDDQIPILILHILEANVPQDARIVNEHIDPPKRLDGRLNDLVAVLDAFVVRDRLAACGFDLVDDYISGLYPPLISLPYKWGRAGMSRRLHL